MKTKSFIFAFYLTIQLYSLNALCQTDSLATIYLYTLKPGPSSNRSFDISRNDEKIMTIDDGAEVIYKCKPGKQEFAIKIKNGPKLIMDIEPGMEYFLEYTIGDYGKADSQLKQKDKANALPDLQKIYEKSKAKSNAN